MIEVSWIEKGQGLIEELAKFGIDKNQRDSVCYISPDSKQAQAQNIIDTFDPLEYERGQARLRIIRQFEEATSSLESAYPEVEKRTFIKQEIEARAYLADSTVDTPTLTPIATARNITVQEQAERVKAKADLYTATVAALIGRRQAQEDVIDTAADWEEARNINL